MRIAFAQNLWEELLGPLILAEVLEREGHEARFFLEERGWFDRLVAFRPDVVALSVATGNHHWMLAVADRVKASVPGPPLVVMGGPHPTFFPEVIEHPALDAICRGEGEEAFPRLLAGIEGGRLPTDVPNFWVKQNGDIHQNEMASFIRDLDQVPFPRRASLYRDYPFLRRSPFKRVIASRGCPFACTYCFNHVYRELMKGKGSFLRRRSVGNVIEELQYLKERFGYEHIDFFDDLFILDKKWLLEFADEFKRAINVPWACNIHVKVLDEEIAEAMERAGCYAVAFGLESGSERIRKEIMNKNTTNDEITECARLLHQHNILFQTFNMLGLPGETLEEAFETVHLNQRIKPFFGWCSLATPLPGTRFAEMCEAMGAIDQERQVDDFRRSWFDRNIIQLEDRKEIVNLQKFFAMTVRFPGIEPLVRKLIKAPPNTGYRIMYQAFYGYHMKVRSHMGWGRAAALFFQLRKQY